MVAVSHSTAEWCCMTEKNGLIENRMRRLFFWYVIDTTCLLLFGSGELFKSLKVVLNSSNFPLFVVYGIEP